MDIESYVKNNISELSPIKEQLGGTFYVTAIEVKDVALGGIAQGTSAREGSGTVSYEDGHNAYTADFKYMVSEEGKPTVKYFRVRE
jgi:hypothetical protein